MNLPSCAFIAAQRMHIPTPDVDLNSPLPPDGDPVRVPPDGTTPIGDPPDRSPQSVSAKRRLDRNAAPTCRVA